MKLSTRARYALRVMLDVARHGGETTPVPLAAVAHRTGLSHGYLEQLATGLRQAQLLRGVAGRNGGYVLRAATSEIRVGDVVQSAIGRVCLVECVLNPSVCERAALCETRAFYCVLNSRIEEVMDSLTLADLLDSDWLARYRGVVADPLETDSEKLDPCTAAHGPRRSRSSGPKKSVPVT